MLAFAALVVSVLGYMHSGTPASTPVAGTDPGFFTSFHAGMADGGDIVATSTPTNSTLLARDLIRAKQIDMTITQSNGTLTLPATTTLAGWLPSAGDTRTVLVRNATTSASVSLTIAVGTGMTLKNASSTGVTNAVIPGDTDGKSTAEIVLVRQLNRDITVFVTKFAD